jgi:hypothetical protein
MSKLKSGRNQNVMRLVLIKLITAGGIERKASPLRATVTIPSAIHRSNMLHPSFFATSWNKRAAPYFHRCGKIISTSGHSLCHLSDINFAGAEQPNMNDLMDLTHRSLSSDHDSGFGQPLVVLKSDAGAGFGRLRSTTFIAACVTATVGWVWLLVDVAEWLIGV